MNTVDLPAVRSVQQGTENCATSSGLWSSIARWPLLILFSVTPLLKLSIACGYMEGGWVGGWGGAETSSSETSVSKPTQLLVVCAESRIV